MIVKINCIPNIWNFTSVMSFNLFPRITWCRMEKLSPETLFNFLRLHCCGGHTSQRPLLRFFSLSVACTSLKKIQLKLHKNWVYGCLLFLGSWFSHGRYFSCFGCPLMTEEFAVLQCHHSDYPWPWGDVEEHNKGDGTKIYMELIFCIFIKR